MFAKELFGVTRPIRQLNLVYTLIIRSYTHIKIVMVREEISIILKELGDQFLDVSRVCLATDPLFVNTLEKTIRIIEFASLEFDHPLWVLSNKESNDITWA